MLAQHMSSVSCKIKVIKTQGDHLLDVPLAKSAERACYQRIEQSLLRGEIDFAVAQPERSAD